MSFETARTRTRHESNKADTSLQPINTSDVFMFYRRRYFARVSLVFVPSSGFRPNTYMGSIYWDFH